MVDALELVRLHFLDLSFSHSRDSASALEGPAVAHPWVA